jgi:hypothetical protein
VLDKCYVTEGDRAVCDAHASKCSFCGARFCKDCSTSTCTHIGHHGHEEVELHVITVSISEDGDSFQTESFVSDATMTSDVPGWLAAFAAATKDAKLDTPKRVRGMIQSSLLEDGDYSVWHTKADHFSRYDGSDAALTAMSALVAAACPKDCDMYHKWWLTRDELFFDYAYDEGRDCTLITSKPRAGVKAALKAAMLKSRPGDRGDMPAEGWEEDGEREGEREGERDGSTPAAVPEAAADATVPDSLRRLRMLPSTPSQPSARGSSRFEERKDEPRCLVCQAATSAREGRLRWSARHCDA